MRTKQHRRRILAGFMLVVFALSITPRITLHNWFASHTDTAKPTYHHNGKQQLNVAVYNCHCDNIVAESPFTGSSLSTGLKIFRPLSLLYKVQLCTFYSSRQFQFALRGPPVQV